MRRLSLALALAASLLAFPRTTHGWNKTGHMVTGAIGYRELKDSDAQALNRVVEIFKEHPFYEERWLSAIEALNDDDPDKECLFLFMHAARWPDDVRGDPEWHCAECHFINFRFRPGQANNSPATQADTILTAFRDNIEIAGGDSSDEEKAMALSWVFYLVGDVHQPLHSATLVTSEFPQVDRGGTRFFIHARQEARTISLHKFWDDLIIGSERFRSVNNRARGQRQRPEFRRNGMSELSEARFAKWADTESFSIAKRHAYRDGNLRGSSDRNDGAVLPQDYAAAVQPIAERRAVLAGYRLADLLGRLF